MNNDYLMLSNNANSQNINNNAIIYARVSTKKQNDDEHNGLETQFKECVKEINTNHKHLKIIDYVSEIGSSFKNKDALVNLTFLLNTHKNITIFIFDTSRFGRNYDQIHHHISLCNKNNIVIRSVKDLQIYGLNKIQSNQFISKTMESIQYSNMLSERVKAGLENKKQKGEYTGGKIPLGYQIINKKLKKLPHADAEIKKITSKINMGENIKDIVNHVNKINLFNKKTWTISSIKAIIKKFNPFFTFNSLNLDSLKMELNCIDEDKEENYDYGYYADEDINDKKYFIEDAPNSITSFLKKSKFENNNMDVINNPSSKKQKVSFNKNKFQNDNDMEVDEILTIKKSKLKH